jgi:hypothetical protein
LNQKDKQLEKVTHDKEQIEQDHDRMKRKIESMSQSDNPAEEELRQECEELRVQSSFCLFFSNSKAALIIMLGLGATQMQCMPHKIPFSSIVTLYAHILQGMH